jgi:transposase
MTSRKSVKWTKQPHSNRKQAEVIDFLESQGASHGDHVESHSPQDCIFTQCGNACNVSKSTIRRWWKYFGLYGELPYEGKAREQRLKSKYNWLPPQAKIEEGELNILKALLEKEPHRYLDEISVALGRETGKYFSPSTVWRYATKYLNFSLQALTEKAAQRSELIREEFKIALQILLHNGPDMLLLVDETHKDRNAARRRRGWGKRNSGGVVLNQWFRMTARYTLIAAADINGFIEPCCETVDRNEISAEGAAGTVDREYFTNWVKEKLCPVLGNYERGEPRSVGVLDNASTHMSDEVINSIQATGAYIIYSPPFSPDLNPIENYFGIYKAKLKRLNLDFDGDWEWAHFTAMSEINRKHGIKFFRRCGIPGSDLILTVKETKEVESCVYFILFLLLIQVRIHQQ